MTETRALSERDRLAVVADTIVEVLFDVCTKRDWAEEDSPEYAGYTAAIEALTACYRRANNAYKRAPREQRHDDETTTPCGLA